MQETPQSSKKQVSKTFALDILVVFKRCNEQKDVTKNQRYSQNSFGQTQEFFALSNLGGALKDK